jgi:hypothetical protein
MTTRDRLRPSLRPMAALAFALTATVALMGATASPSNASTLRPSQPPVVAVPSHPSAANTVNKDDFFAGYSATPLHGLASASATFTIPTLNCSSGIDDPIYFGPYTDNNSAAATSRLVCNGTTPTYTYWLLTAAGLVDEPGAAAGDVVVTSVFQTGTWAEAEIHDLTNGEYWVADDDAAGTATDVFIGDNEPYATASLPQFTPTTFSSVQVNGDYLGFENPSQYIINRGSGTLTTSSALSDNGSKFSVTFKKSS